MANLVELLNTIRYNGTQEYIDRVPVATQSNLAAVGAPITSYQSIQNEFLTSLVNKIAMQIVNAKIAKNPLSILKKGTIPLGADIEEIFTNAAQDTGFDPTGANLLTRHLPDTKTIYHRMNRQAQYPVTISRAQLQTAFTSWGKLEELITSIVNSLYSGDNLDEFILMKNLIADGVENGYIKLASVDLASAVNGPKNIVKALKNASKYMQFYGTNFNKYADVMKSRNPSWTGAPVMTATPLEDQIILIRADIATEIDVEVLAHAFNMTKAEVTARMVEVDSFGAADNVYSLLCDRSLFQVYDNLNDMTEFYNPKGMYWTYYWNHWQTYSLSLFANAVAFVRPDVNITDFDALDGIDAGSITDDTALTIEQVKNILPEAVSANGGMLMVKVASWTDTDTYNAAAAAAYTFTAVLDDLPAGVTNTGSKTATVEVTVTA